MATKSIKLNNSADFPMVGLGTYRSEPGVVEQAIKDAVEAGYRHFDCAWFYGNEEEIGKAFKELIDDGKIKRDDIFITTKLWNNFHEKEKVVPSLKDSLKKLQMDYVDLYLIHWPFGFKENVSMWPADEGKEAYSNVDYVETWQGMENCVKLGLAKSIGISNFNSVQIDRLLKTATIKPVVNQVEAHPHFNQKKLIQFCKERDIVITAYCPLGKGAAVPTSPVNDAKIIEIGHKYNKTSAQIILNYLVNNLGVVVIPKSVTKSRIISNIDIFDFSLKAEDVAYLDSINQDQRIVPLDLFADHPHFPFNIEY